MYVYIHIHICIHTYIYTYLCINLLPKLILVNNQFCDFDLRCQDTLEYTRIFMNTCVYNVHEFLYLSLALYLILTLSA